MPRKIRVIPSRRRGTLVEVTNRTLHGHLLIQPCPEVNDIVAGILGRAMRRYQMRVCALIFMSSHFHLLLDVDDARQLSRFMGYVGGNVAKEIGRRLGWKEKIWARRFQAILVSDEEEAQVGRLAYLLSHGIKEGLVSHPSDWPGLHSVDALLQGTEIVGHWYDRSKEYAARRRGKEVKSSDFATEERIALSPLPCWAHKSAGEIREAVAGLLESVVEEHTAARDGKPVLGVEAIRAQDPMARPPQPKVSPAPAFHAHTREAFEELRNAYNAIVSAYRLAAERLEQGLSARFPEGCFPPPLPYGTSLASALIRA